MVVELPSHLGARPVEREVPPHKLSFTWGWVGNDSVGPGSTLVEIAVAADGGGSLVTLTHGGLPVDMEALHRLGWDHYLTRLAVAGQGGDPGPDPGAG